MAPPPSQTVPGKPVMREEGLGAGDVKELRAMGSCPCAEECEGPGVQEL